MGKEIEGNELEDLVDQLADNPIWCRKHNIDTTTRNFKFYVRKVISENSRKEKEKFRSYLEDNRYPRTY